MPKLAYSRIKRMCATCGEQNTNYRIRHEGEDLADEYLLPCCKACFNRHYKSMLWPILRAALIITLGALILYKVLEFALK